jgi:hypothetical protein
VLKKALDTPNIVRDGRMTLGPYRKCPGVKRGAGAPQRSAGALSIRALEGSRWQDEAGAPHVIWVLNVGECVEGAVACLVGSGESGRADGQQGEMAC